MRSIHQPSYATAVRYLHHWTERTHILIYDDHGSHVKGHFLKYYRQNKIHILLLPPHISHLVQPLDVDIFCPVKKVMTHQLGRILRTQFHKIEKREFIECYYDARNIAFTKQNIQSAWPGAGLLPFPPQKSVVQHRMSRFSHLRHHQHRHHLIT